MNADVLDAKMQKRQKNTYGFLLIPGQNHGKREIIDTAVKCLCESDCYTDCAVGIVALTHIHDARQSTDRADVQIIEAVLSACQRQNNRVCGSLLYEFGRSLRPGRSVGSHRFSRLR